MTAFLSFLALIPKVIDLVVRLAEQAEKNNLEKWLSDVDASIKQLESAKTSQEKRDAAVFISRVIARRK